MTAIPDTPRPTPRRTALSHTFRLDPDLRSVAIARRHVSAVVAEWGTAIDVDTAILLTSELVANAVIHASVPGEPVWLAIICCGDHLRVEVHDPAGHDVECKCLTMDGESGRGLAIVAALADYWGWEPTAWGKNVYFHLSAATAAQAA
ncbi:ATP-binding protein [Thermopolyspora sp. NPDC052614]|uniref:ATP-binding protein n=1 Tax=Thermopolyspora sp. NPDC052614 TaxID=3155682 RepID=UPI00343FAF1A